MSDAKQFESRLWSLLEGRKLTDLSQFHRPGFFDEVPLYSRQSDIDFLPDDKDETSTILLRFALKFLNSVVAYESHHLGFMAAITIWDFSDVPIVPNLFVCCESIEDLEDKLTLRAVKTSFGKRIEKLVLRLGWDESLTVVEDVGTLPDTPRIFVAPTQSPCRGYVTVDHFRKRAKAAK